MFLSPDGTLALTNAADSYERGALTVWNTHSKAAERVVKITEPSVLAVLEPRWLPDGQRFVIWKVGQVQMWNARTGLQEKTIAIKPPVGWPTSGPPSVGEDVYGPLSFLAMSPDGEYIAAASTVPEYHGVGGVGIWRLSDGSLQRVLPTRNQRSASFSPDGKVLAIAEFGRATELWVWREPDEKPRRVLTGPSYLESPAWSPDGANLAFNAGDSIAIHDAKSGQLTVRLSLGGPQYNRDAGDWIAWMPQGFYNASPRGEARFRWREGDLLLPRGGARDLALRRKLRRPQMIARALGAAP